MAIRTVFLDTPQLPPILLRRGFEQALNREKVPVLTRNGEAQYYAEGMVPGVVSGRFNFDPGFGSVRIRVVGDNPNVEGIVRLEGRVTISAPYTRGARMSDRNSHITVTAERVRHTDERPGGRGFLPAIMPVSGTLLDARPQDANDPNNPRWNVDVALEAEDSYLVDGLAEFVSMVPIPDELLGAKVRPVDLKVRYTTPDAVDVSQRNRAELLLSCTGFEALGIQTAPTSSRSRRNEEPTPEVATADA